MIENTPASALSDDQQDMLNQIEDNSWWFQYRAKVIVGLMNKYFDKVTQTVDIGGGNGYTTSVALQNGFKMSLLEPSEGACINAKKRGIDARVGTLTDEYPKNNTYSQVLLLDVLEHIEEDESFLDLLHNKIRPGGKLLITVPAYMCLWSSEDDYAKHFRRYAIGEIVLKAMAAGFDVLYAGYFMQFLFFPILFMRVGLEKIGILKKRKDRTEEEMSSIMNKQFSVKPGLFNTILTCFENIEFRKIMNSQKLLFGSSIIIVLKK